VDHAETYVQGNVHTNGIENFWSLLKRAIKGTYVSVEPFPLFRYLDEQAFRFNERKATDSERFVEVVQALAVRRDHLCRELWASSVLFLGARPLPLRGIPSLVALGRP